MEQCKFYLTHSCPRYNAKPTDANLDKDSPECITFGGQYSTGKEAGCVEQAQEKNQRLKQFARQHRDSLKIFFSSKPRCLCGNVI